MLSKSGMRVLMVGLGDIASWARGSSTQVMPLARLMNGQEKSRPTVP